MRCYQEVHHSPGQNENEYPQGNGEWVSTSHRLYRQRIYNTCQKWWETLRRNPGDHNFQASMHTGTHPDSRTLQTYLTTIFQGPVACLA